MLWPRGRLAREARRVEVARGGAHVDRRNPCHSAGASDRSIRGPAMGNHFGCAGAFMGHMPAASQVLLSLRELQERHAVTMLLHTVRPPALRGTT
jgi:hypothetical protein